MLLISDREKISIMKMWRAHVIKPHYNPLIIVDLTPVSFWI